MHIDHVYPWSKGGSNDLENLQVLCAACNMTKGAALAGDTPVLPVTPEIGELARRVGLQPPHSIDGLKHLVEVAVAAGEDRVAIDLAWALSHHPDGSSATLEAVGDALVGVRGTLALHVDLFRLLGRGEIQVDCLARFVSSADREVSDRAAAELSARQDLDTSERNRLARQALGADDPRVRAIAALTIGSLTDDDEEWREMLALAIDEGDQFTRSVSALRVGSEAADRALAYEYLEIALRSPSPIVAAEAARQVADQFADEPEIAARYVQIADELDPEYTDS